MLALGQCGNGVLCVAAWLARAGVLAAGPCPAESIGCGCGRVAADSRVRVDMGEPRFAPHDIALDVGDESDRYTIDVVGRPLEIGAVSMGNPHAVIEVDDIASAAVEVLGPQVEHAAAFAHGCNVGFAEVRNRGAIALRVWERGVGETLACGSGSCAAVAVLHRRGLVDAGVRVTLPGGTLDIHWDGTGHPLWMTGPAAFVFEGVWNG